MTARRPVSTGPLSLCIKEPSPGLFSWVLTQLHSSELGAEVCIDASDHPYPSHDVAMSMGQACLKAYKAAARETFFSESHFTALPMRQQVVQNLSSA